jgi:hypothetical protein
MGGAVLETDPASVTILVKRYIARIAVIPKSNRQPRLGRIELTFEMVRTHHLTLPASRTFARVTGHRYVFPGHSEALSSQSSPSLCAEA